MADSSPLAHSPTLAVTEPRGGGGDDARLDVGAKVGEYLVERFIGGGAMGEVYAGRHPVIGKRVAIKVLRHELASSAEAAERFIREARAVNQIEHDNVIDVFAFGRLDDGRLYLVMDLVDGRSLRAHLVDGPLEPGAVLEILEPIADALDAAHARGVIHRDLKPDNIVLSNTTPPKVFVLDFGIAKLISTANEGKPTGPGTLTGAGTWLGTPGYMAPEQWSVDGAGPASDRYALGVIAFELLSGAQPYSATSVPGMMEQHFRAEIPSLSSRGAVGVPAALDSVVRKALAKDPDARFGSAREFVTALRDAAGTGAMRARGAVIPPSAPRRLWIPAIAGVAVLGAGVVAVVMLGHDRPAVGGESAPPPSARNTPPPGTVAIEVTSTPAGAEVRSNTGGIDMTPTKLFARPDEEIQLVIRKGGYMPETRKVTAGPQGTGVDIKLIEVSEFGGVWRLPNGELRAFERRGDKVDVFKTETVTGPREFFKHYTFDLVDRGIGFGSEEDVVDPRAPNESSCHVHMRVDYVYDPEHDALEQHREHIDLDFVNGVCVERARRIEPTQLARADRGPTHTHDLAAPASDVKLGKSRVLKKPPSNSKAPSDPDMVLDDGKKQLDKKKQAEIAAKTAQKPTYTSPTNAASGAEQNLSPPPQKQILPKPKASPPDAKNDPFGVDNSPQPQAQAPQQAPQQAPPQQANAPAVKQKK